MSARARLNQARGEHANEVGDVEVGAEQPKPGLGAQDVAQVDWVGRRADRRTMSEGSPSRQTKR